MSCIVRSCRSHSGKKSGDISFHKFPKAKHIRSQWFIATDRDEPQHTFYWKVCSKHFKPECFIEGHTLRPRLKEDAVPTLNLSCEREVISASPTLEVSNEQQENGSTCSMRISSNGQSDKDPGSPEQSTIVFSLPDPLAITSETLATSPTVMTAVYEGRIDKLQKQLKKVEEISKNRLLKLNSLRQKVHSLKKKNTLINERLIELLQIETLDENLLD